MTRKKGNFRVYLYIIMTIFRCILFRMRSVTGGSSREYKITHFIFSYSFRKSCPLRANVEKVLELDRPQIIIHNGTETM